MAVGFVITAHAFPPSQHKIFVHHDHLSSYHRFCSFLILVTISIPPSDPPQRQRGTEDQTWIIVTKQAMYLYKCHSYANPSGHDYPA